MRDKPKDNFRKAWLKIINPAAGQSRGRKSFRSLFDGQISKSHIMIKFLIRLISIILILIGALTVISIVLLLNIDRISNLFYARMTFGPFSGIERVLASKRWHHEIFGCTYAIVELTPQRTVELAKNMNFTKQFGVLGAAYEVEKNWKETPAAPLDEHIWSNGSLSCPYNDITKKDLANIQAGLTEPGNWVSGGGSESRAFFLPKRNIIGIYRYGD